MLFGLVVTKAQAAELLYSTNGTSEGFTSWQTVLNQQFDQPTAPCRGPNGDAQWISSPDNTELTIFLSVPCKTVLSPLLDTTWPTVTEQRFSMRFAHQDMDRNILVRWSDSDNYLGFHLYGNTIHPEKFVAGNSYGVLPSVVHFPFQKGHTYAVRLRYDQSTGEIMLWFDGVLAYKGREQESDPRLTVGSIGVAGSVGHTSTSFVSFADFSWWDVSETLTLPVPRFKQDDPRWAQTKYDSAETWTTSQTPHTLQRWGCALTSAVMVLRYHGIELLPSGQEITPDSLNEWLQSEPDGFVFPGLVNWRALTRLSAWHAGRYHTPALEMKYIAKPTNHLSWLRETLQTGITPILDERGHFVVSTGYGPGDETIQIHDPLYAHTTLEAYDNTFASARVFTPSHTDLSAISIFVPVGTQLLFWQDGEAVFPEPIELYTLDGDLYAWLYDIAKPQGEWQISLKTTSPFSFPIHIHTYSQSGEILTNAAWIEYPSMQTRIHIDSSLHTTTEQNESAIAASAHIFSPQYLAQLLSWQHIRSPLIVERLLDAKQSLSELGELSAAQNLSQQTLDTLSVWHQNGWITHNTYRVIKDAWNQHLLATFP